jgi:hypothetical protein
VREAGGDGEDDAEQGELAVAPVHELHQVRREERRGEVDREEPVHVEDHQLSERRVAEGQHDEVPAGHGLGAVRRLRLAQQHEEAVEPAGGGGEVEVAVAGQFRVLQLGVVHVFAGGVGRDDGHQAQPEVAAAVVPALHARRHEVAHPRHPGHPGELHQGVGEGEENQEDGHQPVRRPLQQQEQGRWAGTWMRPSMAP